MALGHWLKDYLGPKASGEGGGGTGSKVVRIGATFDAPTQAYTVNSADATYAELQDVLSNGEPATFFVDVNVVANGSVVDNYKLFTSVSTLDKYRIVGFFTRFEITNTNIKTLQSYVISWSKDAELPTLTEIQATLS